jgi:hypothetical protein
MEVRVQGQSPEIRGHGDYREFGLDFSLCRARQGSLG